MRAFLWTYAYRYGLSANRAMVSEIRPLCTVRDRRTCSATAETKKTAKANQGGKCQLWADRRQREKPQRLRPGLWNSRQGLSHLSVLQPDPAMRILPLQYDSQMAKSPDRFRSGLYWLRGPDLNQRPSGYEPDELPDCSTSRYFASGAGHHS